MFVYPTKSEGRLVTLDTLEVPEDVRHLLQHLVANGSVVQSAQYHEEHLHLSSADLLKSIRQGESEWQEGVPDGVAEAIVEKKLFGFPGFKKSH